MLGGERQVGLVNDISPKPGFGQTAEAAFEKPFQEVNLLAGFVFPGLSSEKTRREGADRLSVINETLSDPRQGLGQKTANTISGIVGGLLPTAPLAVAGGAVGAGVAAAVGFGARELALDIASETALARYLSTQVPISNLVPKAASHFVPNASIAAIAAGVTEAYAGYKGFTIPEHFAEHYNAVENSLDASHAIQDWGSDNYGFLLGAAPLAAGYVAFKGLRGVISYRNAARTGKAAEAELMRLHAEHEAVLKENQIKEGEKAAKEAKVSELQEHLQQAEDMGMISPEMHSWYLDYLENPNDMTKVHQGGLKILQSLQIPYDRVTGRVWNQVLSRDSIKNVQSALFDQNITGFSPEENQLLSSFIVHNELDSYIANMRENPNLIHAMNGMTHSIGLKIEERSRALRDLDYALTRDLPKGLLKKQILSQNKIYQNLKKFQEYRASDKPVRQADIPHHVPKDVLLKLRLLHQIKMIETVKSTKYQRMFDRGEHIALKERLKSIKLMHPADELLHIKDKLMPDGKLIGDFKNRTAYYRLEELSQVWPNAKVLLDRIHMEAINAKQQGLNEVLKKFLEMVDTNSSILADPDHVKRYLSSRIEKSVPGTREFGKSGIDYKEYLAEQNGVVKESINPEALFNDTAMEKVNSTEFKEARQDFEATQKKYKQFSENEKALSDLIKCALGE